MNSPQFMLASPLWNPNERHLVMGSQHLIEAANMGILHLKHRYRFTDTGSTMLRCDSGPRDVRSASDLHVGVEAGREIAGNIPRTTNGTC